MTFQTFENNETNRGQTSKTDLENEIRSTWLGWRDSNYEKRVTWRTAQARGQGSDSTAKTHASVDAGLRCRQLSRQANE
jgi:hypothetical protein